MHPSVTKYLLLVAAATCSFLSVSEIIYALNETQQAQNVSRPTCILHEKDALLAFKQGITSDPLGLLDSWQQDVHGEQDCCRWRGVRCSTRTGHISELRLRGDLNDDPSPLNATGLVGKISPSLLTLEYLEHLDLSFNRLEGSSGHIPEFLGSFKNLKHLNLSCIPFHGILPPQLGNLSKLQYLDLSNCGWGGETNSTDVSWLTRLSLLQHLVLRYVNLSVVAAWPHVVNMIPSLRVIDLSRCSLTSANQPLPRLNLTNLEELDLSSNYFYHPIATCWFWNITNLKHLDLGSTDLYGQLPNALGSMTSLQYLSLSSIHNITVSITMSNLKSLCSLKILNLENCFIQGNIATAMDKMPQCLKTHLQELYLSSNQLTGVLPTSIGQFISLRTLDLSNNNLSGHVPCEIGLLTNLIALDLNSNYLDGVITEQQFAGTRSLRYLYLSLNSLKLDFSSEWQPSFRLLEAYFSHCQMGPLFPAWLQWQVNITFLAISSAGINDTIPHWFSKAFSSAVYVDISNNTLHGGLPTNMETMSLRFLDLSTNQLTGPIKPLPRSLYILDVSKNSLVGPLPSSFQAPMLVYLFLFSNHITSQIPESICKLEELRCLSLANNFLVGKIPMCLGATKIISLQLSNNSLSGELPSSLQNLTNIIALDLAMNNFSGRLPIWIGNLQALQFIRLSHNMFSGSIPISITNLECLVYLDIAHNAMSGSLPRNMTSLTAMMQKFWEGGFPSLPSFCEKGYGYGEDHSGGMSAVIKGLQLDYVSFNTIIHIKMVSIDLSSNYLTGEIPKDIATLDALVNLNLSRNHFSGNVPDQIGAMHLLESLDLSRNKLCGEIPSSLSNLTFLSELDLSYNNLTGRIPSGSQLQTIYDAHPLIYDGNNGLCGPPLQKNCSSDEASRQGHLSRTEGHVPESFYLGAGCGFVVGIWMVFCALLFKKAWRIAYFRLFDKLYDKAYVLVVVTWARLTTN